MNLRVMVVAAGLLVMSSGCFQASDEPAPDPSIGQLDDGCAEIFAPDKVPEYRVQISAAEWAALEDEFLHREARIAAGLDPAPYHPVRFEYEGVEVPDVMIRLRGSSSWVQAVDLDPHPKMQFVISFNEIDREGRFFGVRKILLDMPRTDASFLRQRVALYYLRSTGTPAQCANNARLYINDTYYGLYTNLERMDKDFLQRTFPGADDGDLWEAGRIIKTNEETFRWDRLETLWKAPDITTLDSVADLEASVKEWATEAVPPHGDGYYMGRANFYLYDHPTRGFIWLPEDLDSALDFVPAETTPLFPECAGRWPGDWRHYSMVLKDPSWLDRYIAGVAEARADFDVGRLEEVIDAWAAQIASAAEDDPMKPFSSAQHFQSVDFLRAYPAQRAAYLDEWLACRRNGGPDRDGDGVDFCHDCIDHDATVHPGAAETCNGRDDNCDGVIDLDTCPMMPPAP